MIDNIQYRKYIYGLVFVEGLVMMATEMAAFRILAPFFGSSIFVTGSIIGVVMLALSVGYLIGGRIADRYPNVRGLYIITLSGGVATSLVVILYRPISELLLFSGNTISLIAGSLIAMLILFFLPVALFGTVSPYAIRLLSKVIEKSGEVAGKIFAIGTIGSILGTFLASYLLVPYWGVRETLLFASFLICLYSALPLMRRVNKKIGLLVAVPIIMMLTTTRPLIAKNGLVFETESAYQLIQVYENTDWRFLVFNEGIGIHSVYNPDKILTGEYYDYVNILPPLFDSPELNVLYLGLGAGTSARQLDYYYRNSIDLNLVGVEIDPAVTEIGKKYFALTGSGVKIVHDDARHYLKTNRSKYDLIVLDTYNNQTAIPNHLATVDFFKDVKGHLAEGGIMAANIFVQSNLMDTILNTISQQYNYVYQYKAVVFAADQAIDFESLRQKLNPELAPLLDTFIKTYRQFEPAKGEVILTDNNSALDILSTIR